MRIDITTIVICTQQTAWSEIITFILFASDFVFIVDRRLEHDSKVKKTVFDISVSRI